MNTLSEYFIFFFESVAFFMAIFFFIQYSILRKKEYLFYASYLLFLSIYYLLAIPEIFFRIPYTDDESIAKFNLLKRPVQFFISVFYSLFVMYYLGLKNKSRPLYSIFRGLLILYMLLAFGCFAGNLFKVAYDPVYYIIGIALFPLQLYVVTALFKYKVPYANYIIWGSIILLIGSIITLLLSLYLAKNPSGWVNNANTYIPVMIAILFDIFLFTVALQRKIADNEKSLMDAAHTRQQAILVERERIIADLHDDVGGGLSSIRMMSDLMALKEGNTGVASFAGKISATSKEIAQRMNTIIWSLNTENDTLQNFVEYVRQYGLSYFEGSNIRFQCNTSGNISFDNQLSGVQRKNLFLITKEALHNVLKHSGAKNAAVNIRLEGKELQLEIEDNGKGIVNLNNFGNGLKNMKKRIDEIEGSIDFLTTKGTLIKLTLSIA
jgi:signal transduction histidine kinase